MSQKGPSTKIEGKCFNYKIKNYQSWSLLENYNAASVTALKEFVNIYIFLNPGIRLDFIPCHHLALITEPSNSRLQMGSPEYILF